MPATLDVRGQVRDHWRDLKQGRPGHRFQDRYEHAQRKKRGPGAGKRVARLAASIVLLAIGLVLTFIPGPAILFFFLAGGLLATESRVVARAMDWIEVKLRTSFAWAIRTWKRLPFSVHVTLVVLAAACAVAAAFVLIGSVSD